jgi:protein-S-isoprenylcysteine O-methyltransferase Ste14
MVIGRRMTQDPGVPPDAFSQLLFRHRSTVILVLAAPVAISAFSGGGLDAWELVAGVAVAGAGVALRLASVRCIGKGARVHRPHASAGLVDDGPYAWSRNPLYVAAALMLAGLGLVAGLGGWVLLLLPAALLAYTPIVRIEERALTALIGEPYRRYAQRVPRWLGWPGRPGDAGDRVSWAEVLRREKQLVPGTLAAALGVAAVRAEWLPFADWAARLGAWTHLGVAGLVLLAIAVGGVGQGIKMERHQRRRAAQKAAGREAHAQTPTG